MKLLRLDSSLRAQKSNDFMNYFSEEVFIEPGSRIALSNLSMLLGGKTILKITAGSNDLITFTVSAGSPVRTCIIPPGNYSPDDLCIAVNRAMRSQLAFTQVVRVGLIDRTYEAGFLWNMYFASGVFNLGYGRVAAETQPTLLTCLATNIDVTGAPTYAKLAGVDWAAWVYSYDQFIQGAGAFNFTVRANGLAVSKISAGLIAMNSVAPLTNVPIDYTNFAYCVLVNDAVPPTYSYSVGGAAPVVTVRQATADDVIYFSTGGSTVGAGTLKIPNGTISAVVKPAAGPAFALFAAPFDYVNEFSVCASMKNDGDSVTVGVMAVQPTISLATDPPMFSDGEISYSPADSEVGYSATGSDVTVNFGKIGTTVMADMFGYPSRTLKKTRSISYTFVANEVPQIGVGAPTSFRVELSGLNSIIESYDGFTGRRGSIIANVPFTDNYDTRVIYQPPYPIFIDINSKFSTTISALRVRLLEDDDTPLNSAIDAKTSITLILESPSDRGVITAK